MTHRHVFPVLLASLVIATPGLAQEPAAPVTSFAFFAENDVFPHVGVNEDRNYTGGFGFQFSGSFVPDWHLDAPLRLFDRVSGMSRVHTATRPRFHSFLLFGTGFTPDTLNTTAVLPDDRPYGSIVGVSIRRMSVDPKEFASAWTSEFAVGALGWHVARNLQTSLHRTLRGPDELEPYDPLGWHNQISDGGEPTALYRVTHERFLAGDPTGPDVRKHWQTTWGGQASVGYYTNATLLGNARVGAFNSEFWEFVPNAMGVAAQVAQPVDLPTWDAFLFAGVRGRAIVYNALLQGQFEDSIHTVEPKRLQAEWDLGLAGSFPFFWRTRMQLIYNVFAGRSPEFVGPSPREHTWGSFVIAIGFPEKKP